MKKINWIKQLTRENTLLDRSLRTIAYDRSVRAIGHASMSTTLIAGSGAVNTWYYSAEEFKRVSRIISREFSGSRIPTLSGRMVAYLEEGLRWSRTMRRTRVSKKQFKDFLRTFNLHHAHARGAIVYGYWGEPAATASVRRAIKGKIRNSELDHMVSRLSSPKSVGGMLGAVGRLNPSHDRQRELLCKKLGLIGKEYEAVEILSWFTFFYEIGERVAGHLYQTFLHQLRRLAGSQEKFKELAWYDPRTLVGYLHGHRLSHEEIDRRKDFYLLEMVAGRWFLKSGASARTYYARLFPNVEADYSSITSVKGMTAHPGRVTGTAKIVMTVGDLKKMKNRQILISPMTTVKMMPGIRKAAAIVTDEGGMTAHAAIVAREFNIPCIVGTKIATKVFKDGDRVAVDATRGIVRKISL